MRLPAKTAELGDIMQGTAQRHSVGGIPLRWQSKAIAGQRLNCLVKVTSQTDEESRQQTPKLFGFWPRIGLSPAPCQAAISSQFSTRTYAYATLPPPFSQTRIGMTTTEKNNSITQPRPEQNGLPSVPRCLFPVRHRPESVPMQGRRPNVGLPDHRRSCGSLPASPPRRP